MNKIIADEKDINNEQFLNYLNYQDPSFPAKGLTVWLIIMIDWIMDWLI